MVAVALVGLSALTVACSSGSGSSNTPSGSSATAGGSSTGTSGTSGTSASSGTPKEGGDATMVLNGLSAELDPAYQQIYGFTDGPAMSLIYGNLDYENPSTGAVQMLFLKSMTPNSTYTVWTMTLNPGIKFSDGTPLNAAAIEYNWQRIAAPATASGMFGPIARSLKLKVVNDLTLQVTLSAANSAFPAVVAENLAAIASPTALKSEGKSYGLHPVGAGPFKVQSFNPGESLVAVKNPDYASFKPGEPYLSQVTLQYLPVPQQQATAIQTGQADFAVPTGGNANQLMQQTGQVADINDTGGGGDLLMNEATAPFNNPLAREAFSLAINRTGAASAFATGTAPADNLFAKTSPFYDPKYNWPASNPAKAQQLFNQLAASGDPVKFTYETIAAPQFEVEANYLQSQLASYKNVSISIKAVPAAQYTQDIANSSYQMVPHGLYMTTPVPSAINYFSVGGSNNTYGWKDPTADAAMLTIQKTPPTDTAKLKTEWGIVEQQLIAQNPVYFADTGVLGFTYNKDLTGVQTINLGNEAVWGQIGFKS
jgi:ABC-type transport system substrate-binding protein